MNCRASSKQVGHTLRLNRLTLTLPVSLYAMPMGDIIYTKWGYLLLLHYFEHEMKMINYKNFLKEVLYKTKMLNNDTFDMI